MNKICSDGPLHHHSKLALVLYKWQELFNVKNISTQFIKSAVMHWSLAVSMFVVWNSLQKKNLNSSTIHTVNWYWHARECEGFEPASAYLFWKIEFWTSGGFRSQNTVTLSLESASASLGERYVKGILNFWWPLATHLSTFIFVKFVNFPFFWGHSAFSTVWFLGLLIQLRNY